VNKGICLKHSEFVLGSKSGFLCSIQKPSHHHHSHYTIAGTATVVFGAAVSYPAIVEMPLMSRSHPAAIRLQVSYVIGRRRICDGAPCNSELFSGDS
jgi:hypothetical protein